MLAQRFRFAFVSNSHEIGDALRRMADPENDDIVVRTATMEDALPVARQLLHDGVEVILGGGGTGSFLAQTLGHPVVKIGRSYLDLLKALAAAREHGKHVALTSFHAPDPGVDFVAKLLGVKIRQIVFDNSHELEAGILAAISDKVNSVVGSGVCKKIADQHGCVGIVAMPGTDALTGALREARALAMVRRREVHEVERVGSIFGVIKDGLLVINAEGQLEFANSVAHDLLPQIDSAFTVISAKLGLPEVLRSGRARLDQVCRVGNRDLVVSASPIQVDTKVDGVVATINEAARVHRMDRRLKEELYLRGFIAKHTTDDIKGSSATIRRILENLRSYAKTDANLLIEGETGVGKELFAQSVHNLSERRTKPFVAVNCSALPESLLETELFGYEDGAFTGARRGGKVGLFELAQGGALFLDEIADISPNMQAKLLRVLEERELIRVGGSRVVNIDVRIISSTYKTLFQHTPNRQFRNDLYFRLATLRLVIPPLRQRQEDIPELVKDCLRRYRRPPGTISQDMLATLCRYDWPGNVRELDALIQRYIALLGEAPRDDHLLAQLIAELKEATHEASPLVCSEPLVEDNDEGRSSLRQRVTQYEKQLIAETLRVCRYNRQLTAKRLGVSLNTLWRKMPHHLKN